MTTKTIATMTMTDDGNDNDDDDNDDDGRLKNSEQHHTELPQNPI